MNLLDLFTETLTADYRNVGMDASFSSRAESGHLHILFQWSHGIEDWKNNLNFPAMPYRDMPHRWLCHRGFLDVWKSVEPHIAALVSSAPWRRITIAGYSHGGALATLCHEYIWFTHPALREGLCGIGYGAPRVLWRLPGTLWPKERWATFTVVRNLDDAVTHLPPAAMGYRHVGTLLEIGTRGRTLSIDAHRPEAYKHALRAYVRRADAITIPR